MKVIIHAYNTCCQNLMGGVQIRARKFKELLESRGIHTTFFSPFETVIENNDILHIFGARPENLWLMKCAKAKGAKVILSSIINAENGFKYDFYRLFVNRFIKLYTIQRMLFDVLREADMLIAETEKEKRFLVRHFGLKNDKIAVIPNGVEEPQNINNCEIQSITTKKYALCVGRFDKNKNQLNLINAIKDTNLNLVFVGGADYSQNNSNSYYNECVKQANNCDNIFFLGWLKSNSPLLASAYKNAEVLVAPSFQETFGLTIVEGGMAGAKLAISKTLPILEYDCFKDCLTFNPKDVKDIRNVVIKAFNDEKSDELKNRLIETFSWKTVIDKHIKIYDEMCCIKED